MAKEQDEIGFFTSRGPFGFLSNFYSSRLVIDGLEYPTVEHYYQSQKGRFSTIKWWIRNAPSPFLAMRAGRSLRPGREFVDNWEDKRVQIMLKGLREKFRIPALRARLLETGDLPIHEESPTDRFWGSWGGKGEDMLGKLLMQVREELISDLPSLKSTDCGIE